MAETDAERTQRLQHLEALDSLLMDVEEWNTLHGGDLPVPFSLQAQFLCLGGWSGHGSPTGQELMERIFTLQERYLRQAVGQEGHLPEAASHVALLGRVCA